METSLFQKNFLAVWPPPVRVHAVKTMSGHPSQLALDSLQSRRRSEIAAELSTFHEFGQPTRLITTEAKLLGGTTVSVPTFVNEFWTAKQRQANSLHEISYRA